MSGPGDAVTELWRDVAEFVGYYQVSDCGRVRSVIRVIAYRDGRTRTAPGALMTPQRKPTGHLYVMLSKNGRRRTRYVHGLVMDAFGPARPSPTHEVRHRDGDPSVNRPSNLRWGTRGDNMLDSVEHGTHAWASRPRCSRGHALVGANLRLRHRAARPGRRPSTTRICEACRWAHNKMRCAGPGFNLDVAADERYHGLMDEAA